MSLNECPELKVIHAFRHPDVGKQQFDVSAPSMIKIASAALAASSTRKPAFLRMSALTIGMRALFSTTKIVVRSASSIA